MKTAMAWSAAAVLAIGCGGSAPPMASAPPSAAAGVDSEGGKSGREEQLSHSPGGGGSAGVDPATTLGDEGGSRKEREQKADDCLKKCYQSPAAISGDALRDMCEKQCNSKGSGKVQAPAK